MCVFVCLYVEPVSRTKDYARSGIKIGFCLMPVHTCVAECVWNVGYICHWGTSFIQDAPLVEFMYLVFTRMPGELPWATRVFVIVFVLCISSAN